MFNLLEVYKNMRDLSMSVPSKCLHTEIEQSSICCGAPEHEVEGLCAQCREAAGFEEVCAECREPMEVTA